ncbi:uncharacterized protein LOC123412326 [Hordeum vulgare subsp. vulgare]|uniref:uncharacterized protein LOC123412326 n=1 Tax=Hordeum vulgare subsp. vulgare TaxID=112509 RepID=UPI001D1A4DE0|nr:uncharacterized protein LOC123412326 [Hordeum vulgare subsp. vulgare]
MYPDGAGCWQLHSSCSSASYFQASIPSHPSSQAPTHHQQRCLRCPPAALLPPTYGLEAADLPRPRLPCRPCRPAAHAVASPSAGGPSRGRGLAAAAPSPPPSPRLTTAFCLPRCSDRVTSYMNFSSSVRYRATRQPLKLQAISRERYIRFSLHLVT